MVVRITWKWRYDSGTHVLELCSFRREGKKTTRHRTWEVFEEWESGGAFDRRTSWAVAKPFVEPALKTQALENFRASITIT